MRTGKKNRKKIAAIMTAGVLSFALAAGVIGVYVPVYGAAEFSTSSPFSSTGYSTYYHNGKFSGMAIANGVDMSDWQSENCDLATAKAKGVDFSILRVTWTSYSKSKYSYKNNDSSFASNYKSAKNAGVMVGAYVFSQAKNADEARKEANYAVTRLKALGVSPKNLDLPVYMDYEFAGGKNGRLYGLKKKNATAAAKAFCEVIRDAGYTPGIYASTLFYKNYIDTSVLGSDVDLWCAQYYKRCESGIDYSKWQYSSTARISGLLSYLGVKGNIDVNFWYLDTDQSITPKVTISGKKKYNYTGKRVVPSLTVKSGDKTLKEGTDYILGGISNINPGTAYAYIKGVGKYSGTAFVPFTIRPAKTSIVSLTGKKKAFQIKVKKLSKSKVTGYQVKYSRRSDMEESVVKTIGTKYSKVSKKIKVNARNQLYYVQVRTYKKISGKKYYSTWSDISTVTSK